MKKILFLVFIALAFVGCADPNNDAENTNSGSGAVPGSIFNGVDADGDKWYITQTSVSLSGISQTQLVYSVASASDGFIFSLGQSTIGDTTTYTVITTASRTNGAYVENHWDKLTIKTDVNESGYALLNPSATSASSSGFYTFGMTSSFDLDITVLTTNTTWISVTLSDSTSTNEDLTVTLPTEFITAMLTYF